VTADARPLRVALVGDSIRMGAAPHVRAALPPAWQVWSPTENGESSHTLRALLDAWLPAGAFDLIHLNCGLHDLRHDPGRDRPVATPDEYAGNLRAIFAALAVGGATVVWATITPIDEAAHNATKASRRYAADVEAYNGIATGLAQAAGFRINDLHAALSRAPLEDLLLPDGVHFTEAGYARIGGWIADALRAAAPLS
jgi:lysophospholipase L1-like esterase